MSSNTERVAKHEFTWTIENFKACTQKNGIFLESSTFTAESIDKTTWSILLYPNGRKRTTKGFISCCLKRSNDSPGPDEVECDYTIEAIDGRNKSFQQHQYVSKFTKGLNLGWDEFLRKEIIFNSNTRYSPDILAIKVTLKKIQTNIVTQRSCWTKIATEKISFKWNVKNSVSSRTDDKLVSFSEKDRFEITLKIPEDDVEIRIRRPKGFAECQILICSVTLLGLKGEEADFKEAIFEAEDPGVNGAWKFPTFLKRSNITAQNDKYLKADYFTLKFDFVLSNGKRKDIQCRSLDLPLTTLEDFSTSLKTDLKHMFIDPVHTDVELHADEKVFRVHKVILCARSPVFLAMFNQNMVENQTGAIHISDVESGTLNSLLEFMYTGDTETLDYESALKLLLAADKYQVPSLKDKCSSTLELLLSDENVCNILFIADLIQQESLRVSAVNHIEKNSVSIFKSDEWTQLAQKNLKLATETFCEVSIKS